MRKKRTKRIGNQPICLSSNIRDLSNRNPQIPPIKYYHRRAENEFVLPSYSPQSELVEFPEFYHEPLLSLESFYSSNWPDIYQQPDLAHLPLGLSRAQTPLGVKKTIERPRPSLTSRASGRGVQRPNKKTSFMKCKKCDAKIGCRSKRHEKCGWNCDAI
jgi:hypothetical protein